MNIELKKFGTTLNSRPSGKEAYAAFLPTLSQIDAIESVIVDFTGVQTFTPSWGDEFLTPLYIRFGSRLQFTNTGNPSVKLTLETLESVHAIKFVLV